MVRLAPAQTTFAPFSLGMSLGKLAKEPSSNMSTLGHIQETDRPQGAIAPTSNWSLNHQKSDKTDINQLKSAEWDEGGQSKQKRHVCHRIHILRHSIRSHATKNKRSLRKYRGQSTLSPKFFRQIFCLSQKRTRKSILGLLNDFLAMFMGYHWKDQTNVQSESEMCSLGFNVSDNTLWT